MKLLLDTCVWAGSAPTLTAAGHEVIWVGEWVNDPGDAAILEWARFQGRVLVTLDKDFGELAVLNQQPHCGIIRLVGWPARQQAQACLRVLDLYGEELRRGAIVTAELGRVRIRPRDAEG